MAEEKAAAAAEPQAELEVEAELEEAEQLCEAVEKAAQLMAVEAVAVAMAVEAVADWEAETDREAIREAAPWEEATATPDGRAANGQSKVFGPGGCVPIAAAVGVAVAVHPHRRHEEPQVEEEEEEEELVSNCQPIGLHSSAVCGSESE